MAKVDLTKFNKQMQSAITVIADLPKAALAEFVSNTPVRTGNARRRTRLQGTKIVANYNYSSELDAGRSRQAPDGMTAPTLEWIAAEVDKRLKGL